MTTAAFSDVLASLTQDGDRFHVEPSEDWRQGRTLFGGLSACLAVRSAQAAFPQLPPLRSAQFAFIGPVTGALFLTPKLLRAGKSRYFHSGRGEDGDEYGFERNIGVRSRAAVESIVQRSIDARCGPPWHPPGTYHGASCSDFLIPILKRKLPRVHPGFSCCKTRVSGLAAPP